MNSGIYFIRNIKNNKLYVGSAQDFDIRWYRHRRELNLNEHHCPALQAAWNEDGELFFIFERIEYVNEDMLIKIEQLYLDEYWDNSVLCYNKCRTAGSWLGMKHTDETKEKLSKAKQGSKNVGAKLNEDIVEKIKQLLFENKLKFKEIGATFGIKYTSIISKMISGERWTHCFTDEERMALQQIQKENRRKRTTGQNNPMYGKVGEQHPSYGRKYTEEEKQRFVGINNPMVRLDEKIVVAIKIELKKDELTQKEIARLFNTSQCTIAEINTGKRWSHVQIPQIKVKNDER